MATYSAQCSAVGSFAYSANFKLYVVLSNRDGNSSTNQSVVDYNVYCQSSGSGSISAKHYLYFSINGSDKRNETVSVNVSSPNAYIAIASGSITVTHNDDGTKSIPFSAQIKASSYGVSASTSGTFTLTTINRYANLTSLSIASRTSSSVGIKFTSDRACKIYISINGGSSWLNNGNPFVTNSTGATINVTGLSANTAYTFTVLCRNNSVDLDTSKTISATTYAKTVPTISLSSKTSSSITVTSGCNVTVSSTQYRIKTSSGSYGNYQTGATFTGLSANTAYVIEVKKVGKDSGESGTATISVTTYQKTVPTISLSSKTINSITVSSGCNVTVSSTQYRIKTSSGSYGSYQTSATFSGLSANTAYIIEVKKIGKDSGESGTATVSVTTYDNAKISSASGFNLGSTTAVSYSNPSGQALSIGIYMTDGSTALAGYRTPSSSPYTFTFTDTELDTIYKKLGTANSLTVRVYLRTTCNGTNYYSTKDITVTLTGNQKTGHVNVNGSWKRTKRWINVNGTWKRCVRWLNVSGTWKRCI